MATLALDRAATDGALRIRNDPAGFMCEWMGWDPWGKQIEIAESVRDYRRTAVKSCHAGGKSAVSARIAIWFLHAFQPSIVLTTAPTQNQVEAILWREIRTAHGVSMNPLLGKPLTTRYEIAPDWYGLGFKAEDTAPDRFQGFHSLHALVIIDEAAGVDDRVYEALDAVMTSEQARMLLIGNPTNPTGAFHDAFHSARDLYHCITISAQDTPNIRAGQTVRPYLITQQWIDDAVAKHGENSPYVQARVHAEFPTISDSTLIPLAWVETANERRVEDAPGVIEAGLDVARMGSDQTALCVRRGMTPVLEVAWSGMDTMETVGRVRNELAQFPELRAIKVDVIGIGAGVADRLNEAGYPVIEVNVAQRSSDSDKWPNQRHELWWELRELFRTGQIAGPIDDATMGQLASPKYRYDSRHTMPIVESKDEMRKRGVRSPDRAEALMLAFLTPPDTRGTFEVIAGDLAETLEVLGV